MSADPRESITVAGLRVTESPVDEVWIVGDSRDECWAEAGRADWPEIVAFATAILAANEAWLDSQTPTLEELKAAHPDYQIDVIATEDNLQAMYEHRVCNDPMDWIGGCQAVMSVPQAVRWIAAELKKRESKCDSTD